MFRIPQGIVGFSLIAAALGGCSAPLPLSLGPDGPATAQRQALASFAQDLDRKFLTNPTYCGFYVPRADSSRIVFLFTRSPQDQLALVTKDRRVSAAFADNSLAVLEKARRQAEGDFTQTKVPFRIITTDYERNRVVVDGIGIAAWRQAKSAGLITERPATLYFFSQSTGAVR